MMGLLYEEHFSIYIIVKSKVYQFPSNVSLTRKPMEIIKKKVNSFSVIRIKSFVKEHNSTILAKL